VRVIGLSLFTKVFEYQLGDLLFRLNIDFYWVNWEIRVFVTKVTFILLYEFYCDLDGKGFLIIDENSLSSGSDMILFMDYL